jgi:putative transposase
MENHCFISKALLDWGYLNARTIVYFMEVNRTYRYRLYPKRETEQMMLETLESCRQTYNEMLDICQSTYEMTGKGLTRFDMNKCIRHGIDFDISQVHSQVLQNVNDRIAKAYANFFRRVKEKQSGKSIDVGYPRYKKYYKSFTYPHTGFKMENNTLYMSKIGVVQIRIGRKQNRINGKIKTLTIKRESSGKWFACFSCIDNIQEKPKVNDKKIGIDVGLEHFANLSDGTMVDNPRFLIRSERRLAKLQRRLSRTKKGSIGREEARLKVAILHERISNQRIDFLHKLSCHIVKEYGFIAIEDLNIKSMVRHPYLAKHISDASWGTFANMLRYKAESAGAELVEVNPSGTSQICSQCRNDVPKTLAQRWHRCPYCGIEMHRDLNASINILTEGTSGKYACGDGSPALEICEHSPSMNQEATQLVGW